MEVADGDWVILFNSLEEILRLQLKSGEVLHCRSGSFRHDDIIEAGFGKRVFDIEEKRKSFVIMQITPELLTRSCNRQTQLLYCADLATAAMLLNCVASAVIVESGTGSGSATMTFARSAAAIHSFESHPERYSLAVKEFGRFGFRNIKCYLSNVCENGFLDALRTSNPKIPAIKSLSADGVFLDLPCPWDALDNADKLMKPNSRVVVFSPCHEQISRTAQKLKSMNYHTLDCIETVLKPWGVFTEGDGERRMSRTESARLANHVAGRSQIEAGVTDYETITAPFRFPAHTLYQIPHRGHTGYLLCGTKPPLDECDVEYTIESAPCRIRQHVTRESKKIKLN